MKKVLLIMAAALMTMTQCRKQETVPATPSANTIKMTITAGPGAKTNIDDNGAITWTSGDKLYVSDGTKWLGSLTLNSAPGNASGTFTGTIQGIGDGEKTCHFFYLGHDNGMAAPTANTTTAVSISFASQDGTRGGALKYHLGHGSADVTVRGGVATGAVAMRTEIAIAHLKLTMDSQPYKGAVKMTGVSSTMTVKPDGTFSSSGNGIGIGNNGGSDDRYVTLIPTGPGSVEVGFTGIGVSLTFGQGIQSNNLYGMATPILVALTLEDHAYVDLGLPSKLLWATCNLGASKPEDYGDYYQWGGVTSVTSTDINVGWAGCPFTNGTYSPSNKKVFTKYVPTGKTEYWAGSGDPDNKLVLDPEDDAASTNWGGSWRMPTEAEFQELIDNTTCTWTTENGVYGRKFTSKADNSKYIFLPAAGYRNGKSLSSAGSGGHYWSSSLNTSDPNNGRKLHFHSSNFYMNYDYRYLGLTVRPVCSPQN